MCGRITGSSSRKDDRDQGLDERFRADLSTISKLTSGRYNVGPRQQLPAIEQAKDGRRAVSARWGLLPRWAKSSKDRLQPINARDDKLLSSKLWKPLLNSSRHRCLILADGYYEWMHDEDRKRSAPTPWLHQVDDGQWFAFAALLNTVTVPDHDGPLVSATIITTSPSPTAARLHDRMPAILAGPDEEAAWLNPDLGAEDVLPLIGPLDDARLSIRAVSQQVNKIGNDGPQLWESGP